MTAFTGNDAAAAARSAEARELIDRAQSQDVLLTVLSAWDLCALGGPRQALFDEAPARAWAGMDGAADWLEEGLAEVLHEPRRSQDGVGEARPAMARRSDRRAGACAR
jgi:hypothetical protein